MCDLSAHSMSFRLTRVSKCTQLHDQSNVSSFMSIIIIIIKVLARISYFFFIHSKCQCFFLHHTSYEVHIPHNYLISTVSFKCFSCQVLGIWYAPSPPGGGVIKLCCCSSWWWWSSTLGNRSWFCRCVCGCEYDKCPSPTSQLHVMHVHCYCFGFIPLSLCWPGCFQMLLRC